MIIMDSGMEKRFNKIDTRFDCVDENFLRVNERMQNHMNDDHHVIIERFDDIDKTLKKVNEAISTLRSQINSKNVGYAGVITSIITLITLLLI